MRRILIVGMLVLGTLLFCALVLLILPAELSHVHASPSFIISTTTPTAQPASTISTQFSGNTNQGIDPTILAAIIAGVFTVIVSLLTIRYQARLAAKAEQARQQTEQLRQAEQQTYAEKLLILQQELASKQKIQERDEQRATEETEQLRKASLQVKTTAEHVAYYRTALPKDPLIAEVQILGMTRPLAVINVYVRVRLHEDARLGYDRVEVLHAASERDPNLLLKFSRERLASRVSAALEPEEAIRRYHHCVIVGDPGAGKTTMLKYLTLKALDQQLSGLPDLPIHISLNEFVKSEHSDLLAFAASTWEKRYGFPALDARKYMDEVLKKGEALLLLDALDETVAGKTSADAEASYQRVAEIIIQIKTRYSSAPIAVTARKAGYHGRAPLVGFTELEVLDFRPEDIAQFINQWFMYYKQTSYQGSAADLLTRLKRNSRVQALAANPLLLSLIVLVYQSQLDLPERRAELYRRCVEILLTEWDASRGIQRRREFKPEYKQLLLAELAWHFHCQGQRYFADSEVLTIIAQFLPTINLPASESRRVLEEITSENGLLKEQAVGWHGFLHLTLQEYFVAKYAIDHQELETLLAHRGDPWWEEVTLLYAGQISDASLLLQKLLGQGDKELRQEDIFSTNLLLAGYCLTARPVLRQISLREEIVTRLFHQLLSSSYTFMQNQIAKTLFTISGENIKNRILSLFIDPKTNSELRQNIVGDLRLFGDKSLLPWLISLLEYEHLRKDIRASIAFALAKLGDKSIVPRLLSLLEDDNFEKDIRVSIAFVLGKLGDKSIVPRLLSLLEDDNFEKDIRVSIAFALGDLADKTIVPTLLPMLTDSYTPMRIRIGIVSALANLGDSTTVPRLLPLLTDKQLEVDVRQRVAYTLGSLGNKAIVLKLLSLLESKQLEADVCQGIAFALGMLGDKAIIPKLLSLLVNKQIETNVRLSIARALEEMGDKANTSSLLNLLANQQLELDIHTTILRILGSIGDKSVVPTLLSLLADKQLDSRIQQSVIRALGSIGDKSVVPILLSLLADKQLNQYVRQDIVEALAQLADDRATAEVLANLLLTDERDIKDYIYKALWTISRRARVWVYIHDEPGGKRVELVNW